MATKNLPPDEARALRLIEAIHGGPEDVDSDPPFDSAALARMRAAIDRAFEEARARSVQQLPRPGLLELAGDALRARVATLRLQLGQLQLAHRNLEDMSEDDLRSLLADMEEYAAHKGIVP